MDHFSWEFLIWATTLGGLSAASLPLGSMVGLGTTPSSQVVSILAAFGAGALIAALSVELIAPTVVALHDASGAEAHSAALTDFVAVLIGLVLGGIVYVVLDQLVNAKGGFLRKTATSISFYMTAEHERQSRLVERLSRLPFFQNVGAQDINTLVSMLRPTSFNDGEVIAKQEEDPSAIYHVLEGSVQLMRDGKPVNELGPDNAFGIVAALTGVPNPVTATANGRVKALELSLEDLGRLREASPEFDQACRDLTGERLEQLERFDTDRVQQAANWAHQATRALRTGAQIPSSAQLRRTKEKYQGAPLAIWLGILLDGIPESIVIGSGMLVLLQAKMELTGAVSFMDAINFTLIAGLFLSNFPEALASSANMHRQGMSKRNIFLMWFSLMVMTAVGAGLGYLLAGVLDPSWLIFAQGAAAGAMLTMVAAAMIPEAVHIGTANVVGLSTTAGFWAAIAFKLLE